MCTRGGVIKKTRLMEYSSARKGGLIAITLDEGDELIRVELTDGKNEVVAATRNGMAIRFSEEDVRSTGRASRGVKAITLRGDDYVAGMCVPKSGEELLLISENGYGKRTGLDAYRVQGRGGLGLRSYKISEQTGSVVAIHSVDDDDDIMMITSEGVVIRISAADISTIGRNTRGVRLMRLGEGVKVVSAAKTDHEELQEEDISAGDTSEAEASATEE